MAKYKQLSEDIIIDVQKDSENIKHNINIILRNTKNENTNITFDIIKTNYIRELKKEVNLY